MNEQARYFIKHPDSKYAMLADNIRHPFNEYFKNILEYGAIGFSLIILLIFYFLYYSRNNNSDKLFIIRLSLLAIAICAMFSYPLNYPIVRLMTVVLFAFMLTKDHEGVITISVNYLVKGVILTASLSLLSITVFQTINEREWYTIAHKSLRGETLKMLPQYKTLYKHLRHNELFLYNYAAELNVAEHYEESMQIARECNELWVDYDLQMLMADNCLQLQQYDKKEDHLKKAAAMCPVKFMPLYRLVELYLETEQTDEAIGLAQEILAKQVKVSSPVIKNIKERMKNILNEIN